MSELTEGDMYRVTKEGAKLSIPRHMGNSAWKIDKHELSVGEKIEYVGKKPGLGHDNVSQDAFKNKDGKVGKFRPNSWGQADTSYLEPA
jgi:hypothetical protein